MPSAGVVTQACLVALAQLPEGKGKQCIMHALGEQKPVLHHDLSACPG